MKDLMKVARLIALYGQLGFTIVTPPVAMAIFCAWLQRRFGLGGWVMLLGLFLGLTASASGVYRFYRRVIAAEKKEAKDDVVYYRHE